MYTEIDQRIDAIIKSACMHLSDWVHFTDFLKGGCLSVLL